MRIVELAVALAFGLAASAQAAEPPPARPGSAAPSLAQCPRLPAEETVDRARTNPLAIPTRFRTIARANVNHIAVSTLAGGTVCVSTGGIESIGKMGPTRDERFLHFPWHGNEAGGYMMVDRSGRGQSVDVGAIPTFSPSRARFASIEISESGFGSLNAFLVMAVDSVGVRQIAKLETIPILADWRIHDWQGEDCINLSGVRDQDVPENWNDLPKARRTRYVAKAGARGWTFARSTSGCLKV